VRQGGEMRKPTLDRRLVVDAEHLIGDAVAPARASPRSNTPSSTQLAAIWSLPAVSALGGWLAIRL
jgi:hypothetical protein